MFYMPDHDTEGKKKIWAVQLLWRFSVQIFQLFIKVFKNSFSQERICNTFGRCFNKHAPESYKIGKGPKGGARKICSGEFHEYNL